MNKRKHPTIKFERGSRRILPRDFWDVLTQRFLPVISLTYVSSVIAIAAQKGDLQRYIFEDKSAYTMALIVALWVSMPAILWIPLKYGHMYRDYADYWYKGVALLMIAMLGMSYVLFPEVHIYGLRTYFAASIPMLFVLYYFFIKGGLPPVAAHPLTALGFTFLIYGAVINFLH